MWVVERRNWCRFGKIITSESFEKPLEQQPLLIGISCQGILFLFIVISVMYAK